MSIEQNKALVRRFYEEVWNQGNYQVADELVAEGGSRYDHETTGRNSAEIQKQAAAGFRRLFPDCQLVIEVMIAEDEWVAARWRIQGTYKVLGRPIADYTGQNMWRIRDGKLVEVRNNRDDLLVFHQLGLIPSRAELWKQAGVLASPYVRGATDQIHSSPDEGTQL
jgi:predicted ester cyclase